MAMPTTLCILLLGNISHGSEGKEFRASISPDVESARTKELKTKATAGGKTKLELPKPAIPTPLISVPPTVVAVSVTVTVTTSTVTT